MEILSVIHDAREETFYAVQEIKSPDGSTYLALFTFPDDTLEWRSAEYQIAPSEMDLLLDIVLYEPVLPPPDDPIPLLYRAETIEEARTGHVNNILATKNKIRPVPRAWKTNAQRADRLRTAGVHDKWIKAITDDALMPIRTMAKMDVDVIIEKAHVVHDRRQAMRKSRVSSHVSRAEAFRAERNAMNVTKGVR